MEDGVQTREGELVDTAGWEAGDGELVPVPHIDEGVWKEQFLDMLQDLFFLVLVRKWL
jgi:hypothetical protein